MQPQEPISDSPMLAAELLVLFTVDGSNFDNALQGTGNLRPLG